MPVRSLLTLSQGADHPSSAMGLVSIVNSGATSARIPY